MKLITILTFFTLGASASAAVVSVATENFDYADTTSVTGETGGSGWAGAWTGDASGDFVVTGAEAFGVGFSENTRKFASGPITVGINDTAVVVFELIRNETQSGRGIGIQLGDGAGFSYFIGKRQNGSVGLHITGNTTAAGSNLSNFVSSGNNEVITTTITYDGANTSIQLSDSNENLTAHTFAGQLTFDGIGIQSLHASTATNGIDDISVTLDTVPEPSSAALLGLGGLALILRRRK